MNTTTKYLLAGGAALVATGVAYYSAVRRVTFTLHSLTGAGNGKLNVLLQVYNPSAVFGYPVPVVELGAFDSAGNFLGTIQSHTLQWVPRGISFINATLEPNYGALGSAITMLAGLQPAQITLQGFVRVGKVSVPVGAVAQISGVKDVYKWGKNKWTETEISIAEQLREKGLHMTKMWLDEAYTVYDIPFEDYPNKKNEVLFTHNLKEVKSLLHK